MFNLLNSYKLAFLLQKPNKARFCPHTTVYLSGVTGEIFKPGLGFNGAQKIYYRYAGKYVG